MEIVCPYFSNEAVKGIVKLSMYALSPSLFHRLGFVEILLRILSSSGLIMS